MTYFSFDIYRKGRRTLGIDITKVFAFFSTAIPCYQTYLITTKLYAGDASGMDTASAVIIGGLFITQSGFVGMPRKLPKNGVKQISLMTVCNIHTAVFPELITVTGFYIAETILVIVLQGGRVCSRIFLKVIVIIAASSVTITEKNILCICSNQKNRCI